MGWKIYAVVALALLAFGIWDDLTHLEQHSRLIWAIIPVSVIAEVGVIGYAFRFRWLNALTWSVVLAAFALVIMLAMWQGWTSAGGTSQTIKMLGTAFVFLLALPTAYALYAYARRLSVERAASAA